jgi:hypothetical protein
LSGGVPHQYAGVLSKLLAIRPLAQLQDGVRGASAGKKSAIQPADSTSTDHRNPHRRQYRRELHVRTPDFKSSTRLDFRVEALTPTRILARRFAARHR